MNISEKDFLQDELNRKFHLLHEVQKELQMATAVSEAVREQLGSDINRLQKRLNFLNDMETIREDCGINE